MPVELAGGSRYGCGKDAWQSLSFAPVRTDALRLELELQPQASGGVLEWSVE